MWFQTPTQKVFGRPGYSPIVPVVTTTSRHYLLSLPFFSTCDGCCAGRSFGIGGVEDVHRPIQPPYNSYIGGIFGIDVGYSPKGTQHQLL